MTTRRLRGRTRSTFLRLCSRAPLITMESSPRLTFPLPAGGVSSDGMPPYSTRPRPETFRPARGLDRRRGARRGSYPDRLDARTQLDVLADDHQGRERRDGLIDHVRRNRAEERNVMQNVSDPRRD